MNERNLVTNKCITCSVPVRNAYCESTLALRTSTSWFTAFLAIRILLNAIQSARTHSSGPYPRPFQVTAIDYS